MTPTTPEQVAQQVNSNSQFSLWQAYCDKKEQCGDLLDQVEALTKERDELRIQIDIQAGSIEAVQAANQRLAANHKECVRCLGEALQDTTNLAVERDALASAAKLALEALVDCAEWEAADDPQRPATEAITALRQAGVQ